MPEYLKLSRKQIVGAIRPLGGILVAWTALHVLPLRGAMLVILAELGGCGIWYLRNRRERRRIRAELGLDP